MSRRKPTDNEKNYLLQEVNSVCPMPYCKKPLTEVVGGKNFNRFQVAHIYPSSPTPSEKDLLKDVELLHEDTESIDNMIALCQPCHDKYDKPRTVEGYQDMCKLKLHIKKKAMISNQWFTVQLEQEIIDVINNLSGLSEEELSSAGELSHSPKRVHEKTNDGVDKSIGLVLRRSIETNVVAYYNVIKEQFEELDRDEPYKSEAIYGQIKLINVKLKQQGLSKLQVYGELKNWLKNVTNTEDEAAIDIIASFFVQNCEALE
ncbi:hypothetical protein CXF86_13930 [Shewanella sp. GutCb]|uniref:ABC-three component system protein n=1 Tax=Shewanella sp. GutCb TaxID=2058315 RepID=UPI000C7A329D|nr:ABC-three component system protein [Shewanella sp. GutCb]PKG74217.1 hypothetical protein CXF86_13930 [Shewanella sp. GutCb]